ncbi:Flavin-linked sulfhydryl oxidase of the mitochondrial IMS [Sorochytrium milnesiophthora]
MPFLGPDGKPCRACTEFPSWTKSFNKTVAQQQQQHQASSSKSSGKAAAAAAAAAATAASSAWGDREPVTPCPADAIELGQHTWTLLHTAAAYYPDQPSAGEQQNMTTFLRSFSAIYPCGHCAEHLRGEMERQPPRVQSRHELSQWMCEMHNKVNDQLGKPQFDCSRVLERWLESMDRARCEG